MDFRERYRIMQAVRKLAQSRGHHGDLFARYVPDVGSYNQEAAILDLSLDVDCRPCSAAGRRLIRQLCRAAVMGTPWDSAPSRPPTERNESTAVIRKLQRARRSA